MPASENQSRYYIVCIHVAKNAATRRVYRYRDSACDGEILCAACDTTLAASRRVDAVGSRASNCLFRLLTCEVAAAAKSEVPR